MPWMTVQTHDHNAVGTSSITRLPPISPKGSITGRATASKRQTAVRGIGRGMPRASHRPKHTIQSGAT